MKDFIEKIEKIGFNRVFNNRYKYGLWRIDITGKSCWHLTYSEVTHGFIPFDDRDMLKKYFASELREISLTQLGIE